MKINEIFYSLQGEGYHSGTPAVFVRMSGCNLSCAFCDTRHEAGVEMTEEAIAEEVAQYPAHLVVITGGEPSLQLTSSLVDKLHAIGKYVAVETNGTHTLPDEVDWITLSPKETYVGPQGKPMLERADELKFVYDGIHDPGQVMPMATDIPHLFLQPCDTGDPERNAAIVRATVEYTKRNPRWRLSLQIHKILNIR
ncbi:MAG: radical SAM protein [Bacteroidales bacterium]|nr:radical SAM protein [Bacteroidales bacterium]